MAYEPRITESSERRVTEDDKVRVSESSTNTSDPAVTGPHGRTGESGWSGGMSGDSALGWGGWT